MSKKNEKLKDMIHDLFIVIEEHGPSDPDEWCEYGSGCADENEPQCDGCANYHVMRNLIHHIKTELGIRS